MKDKAREQGLHEALQITSLLPMLALRDEYGFGQARMKRYLDKYHETLDAYLKDYLTLEDIVRVMQGMYLETKLKHIDELVKRGADINELIK